MRLLRIACVPSGTAGVSRHSGQVRAPLSRPDAALQASLRSDLQTHPASKRVGGWGGLGPSDLQAGVTVTWLWLKERGKIRGSWAGWHLLTCGWWVS